MKSALMSHAKPGRPCVFFDRDGIVNRSPGPGYVERVEDFHLLPDFVEALRVARDRGYVAVVVTNQKGVGKGVMTQAALDEIHARMERELAAHGLHLLDVIACTATDDAHPNRKPNPGMILEAARKHDLDLSRSWMIGDNEKDVLAGQRAGCRTILVGQIGKPTVSEFRIPAMPGLPELLQKVLESRAA